METEQRSAVDGDSERVGIAEFAVGDGDTAISTSGLGSCVGVALYDPDSGVGGLVHAMLPAADGGDDEPDAKYVDTGLDRLLAALADRGADPRRVEAKIAGGAEMLDLGGGDAVGQRNVDAARAALAERSIPLVGDDVGGDAGRSLTFHPDSGRLLIRTRQGTTEL